MRSTLVTIPHFRQNSSDWSEVPEEVRNKLKVHFIRHISELLPLVLHAR